jgi:hypothetical protein
MPTATSICKELSREWKSRYDYECQPARKADRWEIVIAERYLLSRDMWSEGVKRKYEPNQRAVRAYRLFHQAHVRTGMLERLFHEHVEKWKQETGHLSSITKTLSHPSYLRIIGLAQYSTNHELERLLLRELESEPDHWFDALTAITGEDPVRPEYDFDESVNAWIEWGRRKELI